VRAGQTVGPMESAVDGCHTDSHFALVAEARSVTRCSPIPSPRILLGSAPNWGAMYRHIPLGLAGPRQLEYPLQEVSAGLVLTGE